MTFWHCRKPFFKVHYLTRPVDFQIALARIRTQLTLRKATHENALYTRRAELEMKLARTVYRALLPPGFPELKQFSFGLIFEPCFSIGGQNQEDDLMIMAIQRRP
ncbi:MAG: hypothetical protein CVV41_15135 [Candidatus Riflebacteria bacterium HGW-Riflebacteria-1]|jgi:hypothetical protein|nr:MAG: hypothetical protein CVV41_15135 [Candidatus Riflebacteria bacterium HGW-Riflebacteria-1]